MLAAGLTIAGTLPGGISLAPAGLAAWLALILGWPEISRRTRIQSGALITLGATAMAWGFMRGVTPDLIRAISAYTGLIALLIGVSFLQMVTMRPDSENQPLPRGPRAFRSTLVGVHLFGTIINMSAALIVADRINVGGRLTPRQTVLLVRALTMAAFWSPFFGAMAAALVFAPKANLALLMLCGIPLAAIGLLVTWLGIGRSATPQFIGFPIRYDSLRIPALLAVAVVLLHLIYPDIPVLALISILGPAVSIVILLPRGRYGRRLLHTHVVQDLPRMGNEVALFLSAGVLAAGLGSILAATGDWLPFDRYGPLEIWLTLTTMGVLGAVGVHSVISAAALATLLAPLTPNPTVLAMTFLCGWAVGTAMNPMSGIALALQGRYGVNSFSIPRLNGPYGLIMTVVSGLVVTLLWWVLR